MNLIKCVEILIINWMTSSIKFRTNSQQQKKKQIFKSEIRIFKSVCDISFYSPHKESRFFLFTQIRCVCAENGQDENRQEDEWRDRCILLIEFSSKKFYTLKFCSQSALTPLYQEDARVSYINWIIKKEAFFSRINIWLELPKRLKNCLDLNFRSKFKSKKIKQK